MKKISELTIEKNRKYAEPVLVVYTDEGMHTLDKSVFLNDLYAKDAHLLDLINKLAQENKEQENKIEDLYHKIDNLQKQINVILGIEEEAGDTDEQK